MRFQEIKQQLDERRGTFPDSTAYFVMHAYSYLNQDELLKEGIEVLVTRDRRIKKIPYKPTRVPGDPEALFKPAHHAPHSQRDNSTDLITAWARPVDNDVQYILNRLAKPNKPNKAFENIVNFSSVFDLPRTSPDVEAADGPTAFRLDLMPGLADAQVQAVFEAIKADLGEDNVTLARHENSDVVVDVSATKAQLDALLAKAPTVLYANVRPSYAWGEPGVASPSTELPLEPAQLAAPTGVVGVIDSGASGLNPWLTPFLRPGRDFVTSRPATAIDANGHGTKVAGHAAMYDALTSGVPPAGTNAIVPVHIDQNGQPWNRLENETPAILAWLMQQRVSVANLSVNAVIPHYGAATRPAWSEDIDNFLAMNDMLLVTSVGNIHRDLLTNLSDAGVRYPDYYQPPHLDDVRVCSPGDAANALTVGSVSLIDGPNDPDLMGRHEWPSPHTRYSPAYYRPYGKPDLAEEGGNLRRRPNQPIELAQGRCPRLLTANPRRGVGPTHPDHATYDAGTSFSSPLVAWMAAQLRARNPQWTANLVRAVILQSTRANTAPMAGIDPCGLAGLGTPDTLTALASRPNSVTFTWQGSMPIGGAEAIKFWVPTDFASAQGTKTMRATLVLNPQVDRLRARYAATTIIPNLVVPTVKSLAASRQWFWSSNGYQSVRQAEWQFRSSTSKPMRQSDREWAIKLECKADKGNRRMRGPAPPTSQAYALVVTLEVEDDAVDLPAAVLRDWVRLRETVRQPVRV